MEGGKLPDSGSGITEAMANTMASTTASTTAAELVATARRKHGLSQRYLAREAGVPQSTVATIESGQRQLSVAMLERLLAAGFELKTRLVNAVRPSELLKRPSRGLGHPRQLPDHPNLGFRIRRHG